MGVILSLVAGRSSLGARQAGLVSVLAGLALPFGMALAWVPIRSRLPNVDLALLLVVCSAAIGALGSRFAVVVNACSAALWFEFFDTAPFERLGISRNPDLETTLVLALAALIVGELALRVRRHRLFARDGQEDLATVHSVASLVASGEELVRIIEAVVVDLTRLLGLVGCRFESVPGERPEVTEEGDISPRPPHVVAGQEVALPVFAQGERLGEFVLEVNPERIPPREKLQVAVTLAAALGGAFLAQAPPPLPPEKRPVLPLRLLRRGEAEPALRGAGGPVGEGAQETSGFSSAAVSKSA